MLNPMLRLLGVAFLCSLCFGCKERTYDVVYVDVQLTILINDQPLADANVMLVPRRLYDVTGRVNPFSMGTTDQHGQCQLKPMAHLENDNYAVGIAPGKYSVIISKPLSKKVAEQQTFLPQAMDAPGEWELFSGDANEVPACYHSSDTLTLDIPKVRTFEHQFELQSRCP